MGLGEKPPERFLAGVPVPLLHGRGGASPACGGQGNISRQPLANHDLIAHEKAGMHPGKR